MKRGYHHGNLRQALVEAALSLIAEKGPTGFTLSEAAKLADVTPAAVYRHFAGREELLAEVARQGYDIFAALMEFAYDNGKPTALAAFEATGRAYLAFARRYPGHYMAMFESGLSFNAHPDLALVAGKARGVLEKAAAKSRPGISPPLPMACSRNRWAAAVGLCRGFRTMSRPAPMALPRASAQVSWADPKRLLLASAEPVVPSPRGRGLG